MIGVRGMRQRSYGEGGLGGEGAPDDGKHAFSMIGVQGMRQRAYREGGLGGEGAPGGPGG